MEYQVSRTQRRCTKCEAELAVGAEFVSELYEGLDEEKHAAFIREDFCVDCWTAPREASVGSWRARVPEPEAPRKRFVDDDVLVNFFQRLEGAEDEMKVNFRYILALVLMRKRVLKFHDTRDAGEPRSRMVVRFAGTDDTTEVIDPGLDESKIAEVSREVGEILNAEL